MTVAAFARILCATDFTGTGARALEVAAELASRLGASLTVLHVYSLPDYHFYPLDAAFIASPEMVARVTEAAQRRLDEAVRSVRGRVPSVEGVLCTGSPAEEIVAYAKQWGADVVVMGTHGRGALGRAVVGSVALAVLRTATVPVLTIGPGHPAPGADATG